MADGSRHSKDWIGAVWTVEVCEVWQIRRGVVSYVEPRAACYGKADGVMPGVLGWGWMVCGLADVVRRVKLSCVGFRHGRQGEEC